MSRTDTWMPIYIADYLADTRRLNVIQHGAYLLLLMEYWRTGPLPNDDRELMAIVQTDKKTWDKEIKAAVRRFFQVGDDGLLHQKRVDAELAKAVQNVSKRRDAANARWKQKDIEKNASADANAHAHASVETCKRDEPRARSPSPSPSPKEESSSLRSDAGASQPPPEPLTIREALWRDGIPILRKLTGLPDGKARSLLGSLLKATRDDCARAYRVIREADDLRPADPVAWLRAACNDARVINRVAEAMAGICGTPDATDEAPTIDLFQNEWRDTQ